MDNLLKTKEKTPKRGADAPPRKGKTKTFLIGKELKTKDLRRTAAWNGQADRPKTDNKTRIKTARIAYAERRVKPPARLLRYSTALRVTAPRYWGALSLSAMMARARWVRSSFSLGVNRMSPLTQRLISRVAISVMRICSPRSVMEMAPTISIACWHSRMDIVGGEGGMRGRSASSMMARDFLVSSSWLARGSRISPQTQCFPSVRRFLVMSTCSPRIIRGIPPPAIQIALWQDPMDIFGFIFLGVGATSLWKSPESKKPQRLGQALGITPEFHARQFRGRRSGS